MDFAALSAATATVFHIQKFCTDDGPGIRTSVFLKGCHLHCSWCHNPEGIRREPSLEFSDVDCVRCRRCEAVCPNGVHSFEGNLHKIDRSNCIRCGICIRQCPYGALSFCGKSMTAGEVLELALADRFFYEPEGGITVTGGEPLLQPDFVLALGTLAREQGIHFCVETSGAVPFSVMEPLLPVVDLFLFDIKETDEVNHRRHTGLSNRLPLENIRKLDALGQKTHLRCPIIPGVNDRESHFHALAKLYTSMSHAVAIQIMPYHRMGQGKLTRFGANSREFPVPTAQDITQWNQMLSSAIAQARKDG